jgi:hypothetical protein
MRLTEVKTLVEDKQKLISDTVYSIPIYVRICWKISLSTFCEEVPCFCPEDV